MTCTGGSRRPVLAREAVGDDVLVAGSIGPTGQLTEPFGPLDRELALQAFGQQARGLVQGGADLLVLETCFAIEEALWAAEAIGESLPDGATPGVRAGPPARPRRGRAAAGSE